MLKFPDVKTKNIFFSFSFKNINLFKVLFIIFTIGFIIGAILIGFNHEESLKQLEILINRFIKDRTNQTFISIFVSSFIGFSAPILILFIIGFLPIGQPIAFFIPFFHGLGLGLSTSYLYASSGFKGFLFCLFLIAPCEIIYSFILIVSSKFSVQLSNNIFKNILFINLRFKNKQFFKNYILKFLYIFILQIFAAFVDGLTTTVFAKFLI